MTDWKNRNDRWHEEHDDPLRPARGVMNGLILCAIIYLPIIIWAWRTR